MTNERSGTVMTTQWTTRSGERRARRSRHHRGLGRLVVLAALLALAPGARWVSPAAALPADSTLADRAADCLGNIQAQLTVTPAAVDLGQPATLTWKATLPTGCSMISIRLDGLAVPAAGLRSLQPIATTGYTLRAVWGTSASRTLASRSLTVRLPPTVTITTNYMQPLLLQALRTPNTTIIVQNQVDMDLSRDAHGFVLNDIGIAGGVVLRGGRTSRDLGPRLYTTTRPGVFLDVLGDNVRITGMRIQGPQLEVGEADDDEERGVVVNAVVNVEIDHNELSGWSWAAIRVQNANLVTGFLNPHTIHVHDNYIHNNQHYGKDGYGVAMADGGYAWIERNVFDYNRHAITGEDGSDGSGYEAYENLVLQHGGLHRSIPFYGWTHTHQFDMHGQEDCGIQDVFADALYNCGTAGHSMFIRRNSFLYTAGTSIKLRGTPQLQPWGMFVDDNVFANGDPGDAIQQTESGLSASDNQFGVDFSAQLGTCDFDADGINDSFMATGQTWWFSSGGQMPWTYLRASTKPLSEVTLGYFDGDNRCDVKVGDTVYSGGTTVLTHLPIIGLFGAGVLAR